MSRNVKWEEMCDNMTAAWGISETPASHGVNACSGSNVPQTVVRRPIWNSLSLCFRGTIYVVGFTTPRGRYPARTVVTERPLPL